MKKLIVLLPVYNGEKFLAECLDSICNQTYRDFELIVCNDGSNDRSLHILRQYAAKDPRIRVLSNPENLGIVKTKNRLLSEIPEDTDFVAWMDADDICSSERFRKQLDYLMEHPAIGGVGSALEIIDENSELTGRRDYPAVASEIRKRLPKCNVLGMPTMMLRYDVLREMGNFSATCPGCEDYEYWLRTIDRFDLANLPEPLLRYRISKQQIKQQKLKQTLRATLLLQRQYYLRNGRRIPLSGIILQICGFTLLMLPADWILKLFVLFTYRKKGLS
ncbi:MAG: glycosyltransferase family 2 protein [Victivallales bacterium]